MARLWFSGAEGNDGTLEGVSLALGSGSISTSVARTGTYAYKIDSGAGSGLGSSFSRITTGTHGTDYFIRGYYYMTLAPAAERALMSVFCGINIVSIGVTTSMTLVLRDPANSLIATSAVVLNNAWVRFELRVRTSASASSTHAEMMIDGTSVGSSTTINLTTAISNVQFGWGGSGAGTNKIVYIDDLAINDSTGGSQNTWPGEGKCVLLLPTSDNSAGSWRAGSGASAAANGALYEGINNRPPVGTLTPMAVTAGISNAVSGVTTPDGDFNMTTYTAAGLGGADTINCLQQIIAHGEDASTGAKTGTFKIFSNPDSGTANNVTGTSTAQFGPDAGGAVGAYPTNWAVQRGTAVYAPSVTKDTAPVARITKTDTGTRAANLCFMGIYVDYSVGVADAFVPKSWVPSFAPILAQ